MPAPAPRTAPAAPARPTARRTFDPESLRSVRITLFPEREDEVSVERVRQLVARHTASTEGGWESSAMEVERCD